MALPQISIFLLVAEKPGITMTDISVELDMPQGTVSRNIKELTKYLDRYKNSCGYDLLKVEPDMEERRRFACFLSNKGKRIVSELEEIFK
jgi:DNA-binding MarR family transcriptional regulator